MKWKGSKAFWMSRNFSPSTELIWSERKLDLKHEKNLKTVKIELINFSSNTMRTFTQRMLSFLHRHSILSCWALWMGISNGILELISICRITKLYIEWILLASGRASWWDNNVIEKVSWIPCMLGESVQHRMQLAEANASVKLISDAHHVGGDLECKSNKKKMCTRERVLRDCGKILKVFPYSIEFVCTLPFYLSLELLQISRNWKPIKILNVLRFFFYFST